MKHREKTYCELREKADSLKEKCSNVGVGCPRRVCVDYGKITRTNVEDCINRLQGGIEVMQRRYADHMNPDPNKVGTVDNDSDTEADNVAFVREWKKNLDELRRTALVEERIKYRVLVERRLYQMSVKNSLVRLREPFVMRDPRSSPGLPSPHKYWNLYDRKCGDAAFDPSISVRFFGKERKLSLKAFESLSKEDFVDDDIVSLYIELLARRQNAQCLLVGCHPKDVVIRFLNFGVIALLPSLFVQFDCFICVHCLYAFVGYSVK